MSEQLTDLVRHVLGDWNDERLPLVQVVQQVVARAQAAESEVARLRAALEKCKTLVEGCEICSRRLNWPPPSTK